MKTPDTTQSPSISTSQYKSSPNSLYFPGGQSFQINFTTTGATGVSFSLWFYVISFGSSNNPRICQSSLGDGQSVFYPATAAATSNLNHSLGTISKNTWYHLAIVNTFNGTSSTQKYYLNGTLKSTDTGQTYIADQNYNITLGNKYNNTADSFNGYYDQIRIFKTALTDDDVLYLHT